MLEKTRPDRNPEGAIDEMLAQRFRAFRHRSAAVAGNFVPIIFCDEAIVSAAVGFGSRQQERIKDPR